MLHPLPSVVRQPTHTQKPKLPLQALCVPKMPYTQQTHQTDKYQGIVLCLIVEVVKPLFLSVLSICVVPLQRPLSAKLRTFYQNRAEKPENQQYLLYLYLNAQFASKPTLYNLEKRFESDIAAVILNF